MDPLHPVENGCNEFFIVKSVPLPFDYNVLTLLSFCDAVENTASLKLRSVRTQYIIDYCFALSPYIIL